MKSAYAPEADRGWLEPVQKGGDYPLRGNGNRGGYGEAAKPGESGGGIKHDAAEIAFPRGRKYDLFVTLGKEVEVHGGPVLGAGIIEHGGGTARAGAAAPLTC
jgi:hypothetical protein